MPRLRFSLRQMMVVVAVAALLIVGGMEVSRLRRLSEFHRSVAELRAMSETTFLEIIANHEARADGHAKLAAEAEKRLVQVIAKGIPRDFDLSKGVEYELFRQGIPQAVTRQYKSSVSQLDSTIRSERSREKVARAWAAKYQPNADYYTNLRRKYERAARYPWFKVAPDPPWPRIPM